MRRGVNILKKSPLFTNCHFSISHQLEFESLVMLAGLNEMLCSDAAFLLNVTLVPDSSLGP